MGWLIIILLLILLLQTHLNSKYPPTFLRYRHYTSNPTAISVSKIIYTNIGGTFGDGVYVADAIDEERRGSGCPVNAVDVATRFQIPNASLPDPSLIAGWVEFAITRANYYKVDTDVNTATQREFIIRGPLFPFPDVRKIPPILTPALYIGEDALGIQFLDVCF